MEESDIWHTIPFPPLVSLHCMSSRLPFDWHGWMFICSFTLALVQILIIRNRNRECENSMIVSFHRSMFYIRSSRLLRFFVRFNSFLYLCFFIFNLRCLFTLISCHVIACSDSRPSPSRPSPSRTTASPPPTSSSGLCLPFRMLMFWKRSIRRSS